MIDHRVHKTARAGRGITWGAFVVVDANAVIEDRVTLGAFAYVGPGVRVGAGSTIGVRANVLADVPAGGVVGIGETWTGKTQEQAIPDKVVNALESKVKARKP